MSKGVTASQQSRNDWRVCKTEILHRVSYDSLHIALSAVHGVDYLLTWNYRHIDNAKKKPLIRQICQESKYVYPEICTPQELMGVDENG